VSGVYLDYNASGLVRPEVQDVMAKALADNGNPSAVHAAGRRARARVETARAQVAELVGADPTVGSLLVGRHGVQRSGDPQRHRGGLRAADRRRDRASVRGRGGDGVGQAGRRCCRSTRAAWLI
jgi:hypothetical protein